MNHDDSPLRLSTCLLLIAFRNDSTLSLVIKEGKKGGNSFGAIWYEGNIRLIYYFELNSSFSHSILRNLTESSRLFLLTLYAKYFNWFFLDCTRIDQKLNGKLSRSLCLLSHPCRFRYHNDNNRHIMQKNEVNFFFIFVYFLAPVFMTTEWTSETACHKILWRAIFTINCNEVASSFLHRRLRHHHRCIQRQYSGIWNKTERKTQKHWTAAVLMFDEQHSKG